MTVQPQSVEPLPSPAAMKSYTAATSAYQNRDYALAAERFAAIREGTSDRIMARMALFGLACARFMLAETPEAYIQALGLWENWNDIAPEVSTAEDVRFIDPMVKEKMLFSNIPPKDLKADTSVSPPEESNWLFIRTKQEMDRLREKLKIAEASDQKKPEKSPVP